jgi:nicotinate-nucleotide pyrophosphorylase
MVDNMYDKWQILQKIQSSGQGDLFNVDSENRMIDEDIITKDLTSHLTNYHQETKIEVVLAEFFTTFGVCCSSGEARKALRNLENNSKVNIIRKPEYSTTGRKSVFMESGDNKEVLIRGLI